MTPPTLGPVRSHFRAVARAAVPAASSFDEPSWLRAEEIVEDALAGRPARVGRQIVLFLRILAMLSRLRFGRGPARVPSRDLCALMASLERAPLLLLRRGVWGVRTLAFMGCYGQPEVRRAIGYAAAPGGWTARGVDQGPWSDRAGAGAPEAGVVVVRGESEGGRA